MLILGMCGERLGRFSKTSPKDSVVKKEVDAWYRAVNAYASHSQDRGPSSVDENIAHETFADLVGANDSAHNGSADGNTLVSWRSDKSQVSRGASYFLEPTSIKIASQQSDSGESK